MSHRLTKDFLNIVLLSVFLSLTLPTFLYAHPGRTASDGCHYCRTNCSNWGVRYNTRHCHQAKSLPQPSEPIHSRYGEGGTGYTEPAPEYEKPKITNTYSNVPKNSSAPEEDGGSIWGWLLAGAGGYWGYRKIKSWKK